jgi:hypothetical protein
MKLTNKTRLLSVGILLAALTATLYATMQFAPSTQPATIIGKYALQDTSLSSGTMAYRPFFENGAWQGDIIQYEIDADGNRSTDASVGSNLPVVPGSSGGCGQTAPGGCWMARATFESKVASITDYWKEETTNGRKIFTYGDSDNDGVADTQVDFKWSNLSDAQRAVLDPSTAADPTPLTDAYDSPILNYIRGNTSDNTDNGGTYRTRYSLLGDIINSWPIYIGAPRENYTSPSFITFKNAYSGINLRDGRIAVGANDGMLHVFDEDDGSEVYAYVPSMVHGKLDRLSVRPYDSVNHTSYVDGKLTSVTAQVNSTWKSVLAGGLGAGGAGLFALDVTNPNASSNKIIFEVTGSDVGYIYSQPSIVQRSDNIWYIVTGNGYGTGGNGKLLLISLNDGSYTSLSTGVAAGLSGVTVVDTNADTFADIAFAGDTDGNMWKFYLGSSPPLTNPERIYQPPGGSTDQPITTRPDIGEHPLGGYMVLFGTGSITSLTDAIDAAYPAQAIYGIWDSGPGDVVVEQTLVEATGASFTDGTDTFTESVRYISTNSVLDYNCAAYDTTCDIGWKVTLPNTGERVVGPPQLRNSRMILVTTNPLGTSGGTDLIGDSWLMSLNFLTGGDNNTIVLNLNGDGDLNSADAVDISGTATPDLRAPVGLHLGDGNISQPTLASVSSGIDAIFINGLRMPLPIIQQVDGPLLSGHLDVEVDSPSGGSIAPNSISKHSEYYNITSNDGLGYGIDGHVHAYDTTHNVSYVDIFQFEPRRGQPSATAVFTGSAPCDTTTTNEKTVDVDGECLEVVEGELNRAYDTLATDGDGVAEGSSESEVYALGTTTPLASNQKFIVVVANADLTPAAELQIGCRTWNAEDYQDMITAQLEAGTSPASLRDTAHGNATLLFTADDIINDGSYTCPDDSPDPTLRVMFSTTDILQAGVHGTRSQCVLGLHDYRDPVDYWDSEVLCYAPNHLYGETVDCDDLTNPIGEDLREPSSGYIEDPADNLHITEVPNTGGATGYRWRNGALTVQLLKVNNSTNAVEYTLEDPDYLPTKSNKRFGGTYAKAFTFVDDGTDEVFTLQEGVDESGLIHETTMYWHLGDLSDGIQRGSPASVPCYGDPSWSSVWTQETRGLTLGQYKALYEDIDASVLADYDAAVIELEAALAGGDETATNQALLELAKLLDANPDLAIYHRYRDYAPGNIPEQHLRKIDQDNIPDPDDPDDNPSGDDGTPADVDDLTTGTGTNLNRDILGPNFAIGRRTWIDLRQ